MFSPQKDDAQSDLGSLGHEDDMPYRTLTRLSRIPLQTGSSARSIARWCLALLVAGVWLGCLTLSAAHALEWGVNIHDGGDDPATLANRLVERHLNVVRMDLWGNDPAYLAKFRNAATMLTAKGIKIQAVVFTTFSGGQPRSKDYAANLAETEQSAYNQTITQVDATKHLVRDYELQNEVTLYGDIIAPGPDVTGQVAGDFDTPCGRLQAAMLKGMSRAIDGARRTSGRPLRIILGTVNRHWGFLTFMQKQGVLFDVIGYHIYPWEQHRVLDQDPWFGPGGPLGQLALFGKPVTINEFNAGEIYSGSPGHPGPDYLNQAGDPTTEAGFRSNDKHLREIANQTVAKVESVLFYELVDESRKAPPENRFGLYYDAGLLQPKVSLLLAASFAGGALSEAEKHERATRGIGLNAGGDVPAQK